LGNIDTKLDRIATALEQLADPSIPR
jgi:metal-sulfur cluster biosynthetic enzyme